MTLNVTFFAGETRLAFDAKPSAAIRGTLKRNGYRWSPAGQFWHKRGVSGGADFAAYLQTELEKETNGGRPNPVGACWVCGSHEGHFRNEGAASPVWCDACAERIRAERKAADRRFVPDRFDMDFEDHCAAACGLN